MLPKPLATATSGGDCHQAPSHTDEFFFPLAPAAEMVNKIQIIENIHKLNQTCNTILSESKVALTAINLNQPSLWIFVFLTVLSPLYWNLVARNEHRNKTWSKLFNSKEIANYVFSASVFTLGLVRDWWFMKAIQDQPRGPMHFPLLATPEVIAFCYIISTVGSFFVIFSMHSLGIHGTYHGDHFGIFKTERVTGFPFNVCEHPMYYGSTMLFLGTAIWNCSPTGCVLTLWVLFIYLFFALAVEEGFTNRIYSKKQV